MNSEDLFWDLVESLYADPAVSRSSMMGLPCVRYDGRFFASLDRRNGAMLVKLPEARVTALVARGTGEHFAPAGRTFREWLALPEPDRRRWRRFLDEALAFVKLDSGGAVERRTSGAADAAFKGFGEDGFEFLAGLERTNTKAYFDANRSIYEHALLEPAKAFVVTLGAELQRRISPSIRAQPRVGASLFRINNDMRYGRGKQPYKTTLDMTFWEGDAAPRANPALMLRLTPTEVHLGAGVFGLSGERLNRYRAALRDTRKARALERAVEAATSAGGELSDPTRKRLPAGFEQDSPGSDFALRDGFHITRRLARPKASATVKFVPWCSDRLEAFAPVHRWLVTTLSTG